MATMNERQYAQHGQHEHGKWKHPVRGRLVKFLFWLALTIDVEATLAFIEYMARDSEPSEYPYRVFSPSRNSRYSGTRV